MTAVTERVAAGAATTVRVTQGHIDNGALQDCEKCPIALAILELASDPSAIQVESDEVFLWQADDKFRAVLPYEAEQFIEHFDNEELVLPFKFELTWEASS